MVLLRIHCSNRKDHNDNTSKGSNYSNATPETSNKGNLLTILIIDMGMGQYPVLSRGATPPPSVTNPCRAGFVSNLCRAELLHDGPCRASLVLLCYKLCRARGAPALLQSRRF